MNALIGAGAGAIAGATFGAVALALAPGTTSLVASTATIGSSVGKVLVASTVSSVVGGFEERCLQGMVYHSNIAYNTNLRGVYEEPAEPWDPNSVGIERRILNLETILV